MLSLATLSLLFDLKLTRLHVRHDDQSVAVQDVCTSRDCCVVYSATMSFFGLDSNQPRDRGFGNAPDPFAGLSRPADDDEDA